MAYNIGKLFEERFAKDWRESFPESFIFRLHDQMSGYKVVSRNPCDFICYQNGKLYLIECKSHKGASMPIANIRQYEDLLKYSNIEGVFPGVILWLIEKDTIIFIPIKTIQQMVLDGKKSIGLKSLNEYEDKIIEIPSKKIRTFMKSDYTVLGGL